MKIKFSLLLFILAGIIILGSAAAHSQSFMHRSQGDLYQSVFHPYRGSLEHGTSGDNDMLQRNADHRSRIHEYNPLFRMFYPNAEPSYKMRNATYLLDRNIEKAERISMQLEAGIQRYKTEGKDVSRLESSLENYNLLIKEAKEYRALANTSVAQGNNDLIKNFNRGENSSEDLERKYLSRSQNKMIQANRAMKDVFDEFRKLMPGSEELNNTSQLNASGKGRAFLKGGFTINLHMENGEIAIPYLSPDSEINIKGDYVFEEKNKIQDKMRVYHIESADMKISGSDKTVMLRGANISLGTDGEGYSTLVGKGTYRVENEGRVIKEQNWEPPFLEESMHPDEFRHPRDINSSEFKPSMDEINSSEFKGFRDKAISDKLDPFNDGRN